MNIKGFCIINPTTKIINRIREMGMNYYKYRKLYPIYILKRNKKDIICFITDKNEIENIHLLGFSFEGLIDDDDKIKEIEAFGKYRCVIERIDTDVDNNKLKIFNF